jgi:hypothetical protein
MTILFPNEDERSPAAQDVAVLINEGGQYPDG